MKIPLAAAALLLACAPAFAFEPDELRREFEGLPVLGGPVAFTSPIRLPLPELLDNYFNTGLTFDADGVEVRMSGGSVEKKPYLVFVPAGGEPVFVDGGAIIFGSRVITLNGAQYELSVGVNLLHKRKSHVHVKKLLSGGLKRLMLDPTINDIVAKGYEAGAPLTLGGKPFRFAYGRKVARDKDGEFFIVPGTFASFVFQDGDKLTPTPLPELETLKDGPKELIVGAAHLRLSLDGDTLVVEDASAAPALLLHARN